MGNALFIGAACIDVVIYLDALPKTEEDIHPKKQVMSLGGCALNAASAAMLVCDHVTLASPVGTGVFGELTEKKLTERGIPVRIRSEEENGCCYCFVEKSGERTFLSVHGAEYTFHRESMRELDKAAYDYVYVCGLEVEEPTGSDLLDYLSEFPDRQIVYCPGPRGAVLKGKNQRMLRKEPILHLNEKEAVVMAQTLYGKPFKNFYAAAEYLFSATGKPVVVTRGERGVYCKGEDFLLEIPSKKAPVVNTIGAGDTHAGVLIGCLCNGMNWGAALETANLWAERAVASEEPVPQPLSGKGIS